MDSKPMLNGVLLGAGLMYLMDPAKGRRRRSVLRDRLMHSLRELGGGLDTSVRDLRHRSYGVLAEARSKVRTGAASDPVIEARVRSRLGRVVSHPGSIRVMCNEGTVTLSGPVLERELDNLMAAVESIPGVRHVENQLDVHSSGDDVPGLQGDGTRPGELSDALQDNWAPATRLLATTAGGILAMYGLRSRGPIGASLALLGTGLLTRALTNLEPSRMLGANGGRRVIDIHKSINVNAPIETVFEFWSHFENFPRFMNHLAEVRRTDDRHSHWVAEGPAGMRIAWDAEITQWVPNEVIAWKSVEGSPIGNAGIVRFLLNEKGGTRVDIRMTYSPPAGVIGHAIASLFGSDPRRAMIDDLVRLKSLIEEGKTSAHGRDVQRDEVGEGFATRGTTTRF